MSGERWVTINRRVPESLAQIMLQAEYIALELLKLSDSLPISEKARTLAVLELVYSDFVLSNATLHRDWWATATADATEMFNSKLVALDRDNWRCRMCHHTKANKGAGALNAHHIYPRSYFGPERPERIHDPNNLATLCGDCHAKVHSTGWRHYVETLSNC